MNILNMMTLIAENAHYQIYNAELQTKLPAHVLSALQENNTDKLQLPVGNYANETEIARINSN